MDPRIQLGCKSPLFLVLLMKWRINGLKRFLNFLKLIQVMGDDVDDPNTYLVTFDDKAARYLVMALSLSFTVVSTRIF